MSEPVLIFGKRCLGCATKRSTRQVPEVTLMYVPEPYPVVLDDKSIVFWVCPRSLL